MSTGLRTPEEIATDFTNGMLGMSDVNVADLVWEILNDQSSSWVLALESAGVSPAVVEEVQATVTDYMVNNYGDL